ncbi:MAG: HAMP domain-containing sensor histidine kinase, partial [Thiolinea sp.]
MKFRKKYPAAGASGINRKLIRVFVLQMLFISVVTALGVYVAATIVEKVMVRTALENEARHFWENRDQHPGHPTPNTDNLLGYLAVQGDFSGIPAALQPIQPGYGRVHLDGHEPLVYVEDRDNQRLFLVFDEKSVWKLSFYFGVVPLSLTLIVIYLSAWLAYRSSYQTLSPLISLAQTMRGFDLQRHQLDSLNLEDYTRPGIDDEVRVLADSLKEFTRRLQRQLQREQAFTRDVSHELRTPLAVIQGSLDILAKQRDPTPVQQRAVRRMQTTTRDMLSLIENLLLLAREDDLAERRHEPVVINDLVQLLVEQVAATHNQDQHVQIAVQSQQLLSVDAPTQALGIVIGNLLRNACNYTRQGQVLILIGGNAVSIRDTGSGIADDQLERVQQAFQRSSNEAEGYGLGLDIVRRLCERFG